MGIGTAAALLLAGLVLSAFFSGVETALTALPYSRVSALAKRGGRATRWAWRRWAGRPQRILTAILAGNTLVNVGISAVATDVAVNIFGNKGIGLAIGVTTLTVLLFGEVTPKTLARAGPESLARRTIVSVAVLEWLLTPLVVPFLALAQLVARLRRVDLERAPTPARPEDVRFLLAIARQEGHVSEQQHAMLEAVLRFEGALVREVQIPRTDVVFLPDTLSIEEVRTRVLRHGYSRYPVFHGRDDNVTGILLAKDLMRPEARQGAWTSFLQPALFVPESKRVVDLLREMRERRSHIALSVDEYGNLAGLVTLEDLLEMIVGDIQDEFDTKEPPVRLEGPGRWLVRGSLPLDRLARLTGRPIERATDYTSVAGLVLALAGRVPEVGSRFEVDGLAFEVAEASARRVHQVRVTIAASGSPRP
ncbi:MAG: hemolysin family protein [Thermoanaerobaculaceae bacterium]|nr:hemolysin family protein [Thermoanaerobaculaceae bacterium]